MKVLLDTNIIIDVISKRKGYEESLRLFKYCESGHVQGVVSATTVTDILYILRKHINPSEVRSAMQTLLLIIDIASIGKGEIAAAFASEMKDFEDAVQSACAKRIGADYIVTHNLKDFDKSAVKAITPTEALELFR